MADQQWGDEPQDSYEGYEGLKILLRQQRDRISYLTVERDELRDKYAKEEQLYVREIDQKRDHADYLILERDNLAAENAVLREIEIVAKNADMLQGHLHQTDDWALQAAKHGMLLGTWQAVASQLRRACADQNNQLTVELASKVNEILRLDETINRLIGINNEQQRETNRLSNRLDDECRLVNKWREATGCPDPTTFKARTNGHKAD